MRVPSKGDHKKRDDFKRGIIPLNELCKENNLISLKLISLHYLNKFFSIYGQNTEKYGPKRPNFDQISSIYFYREVVPQLTFKGQ